MLQEDVTTGTQQAASSGSWLDVVSAWGSVSGAMFALAALIVTAIYGEIQRRGQKRAQESQEEQLRLAREQAEMRPVLEVAEMRLLDVSEVEELEEAVGPHREARAKQEREQAEEEKREKERKEREQRREQGQPTGFDISKLDREELEEESGEGFSWSGWFSQINRSIYEPDPPILYRDLASEPYEGDLPDKVLRVVLVNQGRTAAYEITGWIYLEPASLLPIDEFGDGITDKEPHDGLLKVEVGGEKWSNLLPTPSDTLVFDIAVKVRSYGPTQVQYEFTTPVGAGDKVHRTLDVPAPDER